MKNLSKLIISVGAVAVASAAMAMSAMAADTITGTYDSETGIVTLSGVESSGDQQTLLVLTEDVSTVTADKIAQVDQDASIITSFVLDTELTEGTYYIRMGGTDGSIQTGTLTISSGSGDVETMTIMVGDANLDDSITASDVGYVLRCSNRYTTKIGKAGEVRIRVSDNKEIIIGDANLDDSITASDVGYVLRYSNRYETKIGNAGQEIEVIKQ